MPDSGLRRTRIAVAARSFVVVARTARPTFVVIAIVVTVACFASAEAAAAAERSARRRAKPADAAERARSHAASTRTGTTARTAGGAWAAGTIWTTSTTFTRPAVGTRLRGLTGLCGTAGAAWSGFTATAARLREKHVELAFDFAKPGVDHRRTLRPTGRKPAARRWTELRSWTAVHSHLRRTGLRTAMLRNATLRSHLRRAAAMSAALRSTVIVIAAHVAASAATAVLVIIIAIVVIVASAPAAFVGDHHGSNLLVPFVPCRAGTLGFAGRFRKRAGEPALARPVGARRNRQRGSDGERPARRRQPTTLRPCPQLSHNLLSHVEQLHRRYTQRLRPERKLT